VSGTVQRMEKGNLYLSIGRAEAVLFSKNKFPERATDKGSGSELIFLKSRKTRRATNISFQDSSWLFDQVIRNGGP